MAKFNLDIKKKLYKGEATREISFPLGGIGTGSIGLTGWGSLFEFEIFGRPNKLSANGFSMFVAKAVKDGETVDTRVLMNDPKYTRTGFDKAPTSNFYSNYGWGPDLYSCAGLPHFPGDEFVGSFPFAEINFEYEKFPGKVHLEAYNPFIPLNDADSSIPAAFLEYTFENTTDADITYSLCGIFNNPHEDYVNIHEVSEKNSNLHMMRMLSSNDSLPEHEKGDICLSVTGDKVSYQEYLYKGMWAFDAMTVFWDEFRSGALKNRTLSNHSLSACALETTFTLKPGEKKPVRFILTWYYPTNINHWTPLKKEQLEAQYPEKAPLSDDDVYKANTWKNYYAKLFESASDCAEYCHIHGERLKNETALFRDLLFSATLPESFIDAISANISILKTPTCLRNEDGSFLAWEGCGRIQGSCEGSCTHVWNYAYALPFLFPKLERSMRENEFKYSMDEKGAINFRIQTPLGRRPDRYFPCADGQFGGIMKIYRDFKIDGNRERLIEMWPDIVKSLEFAWRRDNPFKWDPDKTGVLSGRQHHTLDMELYSPNSWLAGMYLGALDAASRMAEVIGDKKRMNEYREIFEKGKAWVNENLFNGKYFIQSVDLEDKSLVKRFSESPDGGWLDNSAGIMEKYWNEEKGEIMYQYGEGCEIDQVLGEYHANLIGLTDIFDKEKLHSALREMYKGNFKSELRDFFNPCRNYAINDESGMVICNFPEGVRVPKIPIPYNSECMHGFEYSAAVLMLSEGMVDEACEIVNSIRTRYDGRYRNPWNEMECGSNYARSMASFALLIAASGFEYDMYKKHLGINHAVAFEKKGVFRVPFFLEKGYGFIEVGPDYMQIKLLRGEGFKLRTVRTPRKPLKVYIAGKTYGFTPRDGNLAELDNDVVINTERDITFVIAAK